LLSGAPVRRHLVSAFVFTVLIASASAGILSESRLSLRGGLQWVEVRAGDSSKPLNFVVDTGAAVSVLDLRAAEMLGVRLGRAEWVNGVNSRQQARRVAGFSATVANVPLPSSMLVLDLGAASRAVGARIDGLLGADFFRGRIVQLDSESKKLRILSGASIPAGAQVLPVRSINSAICVPIRVNGCASQWVRLDTGCTEALQWVNSGAHTPKGTRSASIGLASTPLVLSRVNVQLGSGPEYTVRAAIHSREIFAGEAGLLGNKLLSKFCVTVDGVEGRVILARSRTAE
jgi:hypothetical protein